MSGQRCRPRPAARTTRWMRSTGPSLFACPPRITIAYIARRTAEGLTKKDIKRCLKRFLAREESERDDRSPSSVGVEFGPLKARLTYKGVNAVVERSTASASGS